MLSLRRPGRRTHRVALPGSENAVRLAMDQLLIPELGLVHEASGSDGPTLDKRYHASFTSTISLEARRRLSAAIADSTDRARDAGRRPPAGWSPQA
jgi:hypothetical protein